MQTNTRESSNAYHTAYMASIVSGYKGYKCLIWLKYTVHLLSWLANRVEAIRGSGGESDDFSSTYLILSA
jgi:hypothetical protein